MKSLQLFARLTKVDESKRQITGILANEAIDASGEVFDYESSKPHFLKWSDDISKATGGKSVGNMRAQHGNVVAGRFTEMEFNDVQKQVEVTGEVVDDNEWQKVLKGCYTGFSIGGKYGRKWKDDVLGKKRYTAIPSEGSIVDLGCNPEATFTIVKADGTSELLKFHPREALTDFETLQKNLEDAGMVLELDILEKIAERGDVSPKSGESKYGDVTFADEKNKKYPIDTPAHIRAAWNYINKPKNSGKYSGGDSRSIKSKIVAAWKRKIDSAGPPSIAKACTALAEGLLKIVAPDTLEKGMYTVGRLANIISDLFCVQQDVASEAAWEGDGSILPSELKDAVKDLGEILCHMADEELSELFGPEDDTTEPMEASMKPEELQKSVDAAVKAAVDSAVTPDALAKALGDSLPNVLGPMLTKALEPLTKAGEEVTKSVDEMKKRLDAQDLLIKKISDSPAAGGPKLFSMDKAHEVKFRVDDKDVTAIPGDGKDGINTVATLIKARHAAGGVPFNK